MEPSNKSQRKPHWTNNIRWRNPDYPTKWAVAIFSWLNLGIFVGGWVLVNILPWEAIGQLPGYSDLSYWMNDLFPILAKIPEEYIYSELEEQLTAINLFGLIYLLFTLLKTGDFPIPNKEVPWWSAPSVWLGSTVLFLLFVLLFTSEGGVSDSARESWAARSNSEWRTTFQFFLYWWATVLFFGLMIAGFRTTLKQIYNFLRRK